MRGSQDHQNQPAGLQTTFSIFFSTSLLFFVIKKKKKPTQTTAVTVEQEFQLLQSLSPDTNLSGLLQPLPCLSSALLFHVATKKIGGEVRKQQQRGRVRKEQRKSMLRAFKGTGLISGAKHFPAICNNPGQVLHKVQRFLIQGHGVSLGHGVIKGTQTFSLMCFLTWNKLCNPVTALKQFPAVNRGRHHADSGHPSGVQSKRDRR